MEAFRQGLFVTVMGMGLVFAALGLLMLVMVGLERLLRGRTSAPPSLMREIPPAPAAMQPKAQETVSEEVAAAITVAIASWRQRRQLPAPPQTTVVSFAPGSPAWRTTSRL